MNAALESGTQAYGINQDTLNGPACLRTHCIDCQWEQHVINVDSSNLMNFTQSETMSSWSPQVKIHTIDTAPLTTDQVSQEVARICQQKLDDVV